MVRPAGALSFARWTAGDNGEAFFGERKTGEKKMNSFYSGSRFRSVFSSGPTLRRV